MRTLQIIFALALGGFAIYGQFRPIRESTIFPSLIDDFPFPLLCILTLFFLTISIVRFFKNKRIPFLLPVLLWVMSIAAVIWHRNEQAKLDKSPEIFRAWTQQIGSDGGLNLLFKKDGIVKAERGDHWLFTQYWGTYSQKNDTITFDLPLNFEMGKQGILTKDSLILTDDTIRFGIYRPIIEILDLKKVSHE